MIEIENCSNLINYAFHITKYYPNKYGILHFEADISFRNFTNK